MADRRTRGQGLVETALILPIVLFLMMGVVDFGFVLYAHVQVAAAAGEGARAGSVVLLPGSGALTADPSDDSDEYRLKEVKAAVYRAMGQLSREAPNFLMNGSNGSESVPDSSADADDDVQVSYHPATAAVNDTRTRDQMIVSVRYRQPLFFNFIPGLNIDPFEVSSSARIRIQ